MKRNIDINKKIQILVFDIFKAMLGKRYIYKRELKIIWEILKL